MGSRRFDVAAVDATRAALARRGTADPGRVRTPSRSSHPTVGVTSGAGAPGSSDGSFLLAVQRRYGNRFVQRLLRPPGGRPPAGPAPVVQPKLALGSPGDRYEREADRVAQQVTGAPARSGAAVAHVPAVLRVRGAEGGVVDPVLAQAIGRARGGGLALPEPVRASLERALGADLASVRVHADAGADKLNRSLRSSAFTTGRDIFFRRDAYLPDSPPGTALLAHEVTHVLQQGAAPAGTVQCKRPETFGTYTDAVDFNRYSRWWLSTQKNDPLERHIGKEFSPAERDNIYLANWHENDQQLLSDSFPYQELFTPNPDETPHVDHRFPKADGGSNTFANAAVISATENLSKGRRQTDLLADADAADVLAPYQHLQQPPGNVGPRLPFSEAQKALIYAANRAYYDTIHHDGELHSDLTGKPLFENDPSQVPHVDHITPKVQGGSNYYFNARIISREENIEKGGGDRPEIGFERDQGTFGYDDIELKMNLEEFIDYKARGTFPARLVKWQPAAYEGSVASRTRGSKQRTTPPTPSLTTPKKTITKEQQTQKTKKKNKQKLQQKLQHKKK